MAEDLKMTRVPPQSLDAEAAVLGSMILDRDQVAIVVEMLRKGDFYREGNGIIFDNIVDLYDKAEPIDLVTLSAALTDRGLLEKVGGAGYLSSLVDSVPTTSSAPGYSRIVRDKATLRNLIRAGSKIMDDGYESDGDVEAIVAKAQETVYSVSKNYAIGDIVPMKQAVKSTFDVINKKYQERGGVSGLASGIDEMDELTSGFQPSDLIILAARPSMGKTSFALNIAENVGLNLNKGVGIFSLEMSAEQLVTRLLCSNGRVDAQALRKGFLTENDWVNLTRAMDRFSRAPIYIVDAPGISSLELRAKARRMRKEHEIDLIIVDYLQLIRTEGRKIENRAQEVAEISRDMKLLARELNVPVIVLSQLSRAVEKREDPRPILSDLRESGSIEQDADIVMFIYRERARKSDDDDGSYDDYDSGKTEVSIAKQRNGPIGGFKLTFLKQFTRFERYTMEP